MIYVFFYKMYTHISKDSELTGGRFKIKVATFFPSSIFVSTSPLDVDKERRIALGGAIALVPLNLL